MYVLVMNDDLRDRGRGWSQVNTSHFHVFYIIHSLKMTNSLENLRCLKSALLITYSSAIDTIVKRHRKVFAFNIRTSIWEILFVVGYMGKSCFVRGDRRQSVVWGWKK